MNVTREWLDDKGNPLDPSTVKQNDLVVARITLKPNGHTYDNIAIEDLLPAGLEVENPNLDTAQSLPWLTTSSIGARGATSATTGSCSSPSRFPGHRPSTISRAR